MGKHRLDDDMTAPLPATVEQLAAQQRSDGRMSRRVLGIAVISGVLLSSVIVWALTGSDDPPTLPAAIGTPSTSPLPTGYVDGFGSGEPSPSPGPSLSAVTVTPTPTPLSASGGSTGGGPTPTSGVAPSAPSTTGIEPVITTDFWSPQNGPAGMWLQVEIRNVGSTATEWRVELRFKRALTITSGPWNADLDPAGSGQSTDTVVLVRKPSYDLLAPGTSIKVGFVATLEPGGLGGYVRSCRVNGVACVSAPAA